jgi:hypothetical protein
MMIKNLLFASMMLVLIPGMIFPVWAAQLDAKVGTKAESAQPTFKFLRTVFIEYPEGGEIADLLKGKDIMINFEADSQTLGISDLITKINDNLLQDLGSTVRVTDLILTYRAHLVGREDSAAIDYKITLVPTITNYVLREGTDFTAAIVDSHWRGISVKTPIVINTSEYGEINVNTPAGFLDKVIPQVYAKLAKTESEKILNIPFIDASGILLQPLSKWHHLFDATGTFADSKRFGYTGDKVVITSFTMGECSIREGCKRETRYEAELELDKKYQIRSVEAPDSANIQLDGYVSSTTIDNTEYFGSSSKIPKEFGDTSTGDFPVGIMYGMAGAGAVVAAIVLFWSDRKLKKLKTSQI